MTFACSGRIELVEWNLALMAGEPQSYSMPVRHHYLGRLACDTLLGRFLVCTPHLKLVIASKSSVQQHTNQAVGMPACSMFKAQHICRAMQGEHMLS